MDAPEPAQGEPAQAGVTEETADAPQLRLQHKLGNARHVIVGLRDGQQVTFVFPAQPPAGHTAASYVAACKAEALALAAELQDERRERRLRRNGLPDG